MPTYERQVGALERQLTTNSFHDFQELQEIYCQFQDLLDRIDAHLDRSSQKANFLPRYFSLYEQIDADIHDVEERLLSYKATTRTIQSAMACRASGLIY